MTEISEMTLKQAVETIADSANDAGGGTVAGLAALVATALVKRNIAKLRESGRSAVPASEMAELEWQVNDSLAHFFKLLDKDARAVADLKIARASESEISEREEAVRVAVSVPSAIAAGSHRIGKVAARLVIAAPPELRADLGIALHLLYSSFISGKIRMNDYFAGEKDLDPAFVLKTRNTLAHVEDEVSQFVGPGLVAMWEAIDPKMEAGGGR